MSWLTWRQFRAQAITAGIALLAIAGFLVVLGLRIRSSYDSDILHCLSPTSCSDARDAFQDQYSVAIFLSSVALLIIPALIGAFWGAPLITRELEAGTHRLVWNQSVTRPRWLVVKLSLIGSAAVVFTGTVSILLTWAASRFDQVQGDRFAALSFGSRNIAPIGYAVFAFVAGTVLGLLLRRTVPTMAATLAIVAALGVAVPLFVRPHLEKPIETTVAFTADSTRGTRLTIADEVRIGDYVVPGGWVLDTWHPVLDANGKTVTNKDVPGCLSGDRERDAACVAAHNVHFEATYQPASRYWSFQWIEFGGYLLLAALVAGFGLRRIRHPLV
jgi:small basic protein